MTYVIVGVVVLVAGFFVGLVVYMIARWLKGSIKLDLPRRGFQAGETIEGGFDLTARKAIMSNHLTVSLLCRQVIERQEGDQRRRTTHEIFRRDERLEEGRTYAAGETLHYDFAIGTPAHVAQIEARSGFAGQALDAGMQVLTGNRNREWFEWTLEVVLDAPGVDLVDREKITVTFP